MAMAAREYFTPDEYNVLLNPPVVVEVLSPSTERYDRTRKFINYQSIPSLAAYLLIAQEAPRIELCARQDDGSWEWSGAEGLDATFAIPALDLALPLAEVYRLVAFDAA